MQDTTFETLLIQAISTAPNATPTVVAKAADVPMRVMLRNIGAVTIFLAVQPYDALANTGPSTATYRLPPNACDVFVIAAKQSIYASGTGIGGLLAVARSEALPADAPASKGKG